MKTRIVALLAGLALVGGCGPVPEETDNSIPEADVAKSGESFESWRDGLAREPGTGAYIVDYDTIIMMDDEKRLRDFYETYARQGMLIVHTVNGVDAKWSDTQKVNLTYCVSSTFGTNYNRAVADMAAAGNAWEAVANVNFIHVSAQDSNCTASNTNVLFDVRPVNSGGQYLARAFFPDSPRSGRNVLIDNTAFGSNGAWTLAGILRHELGHTLGFRHEHTRPNSGTCFEDNNWRALTSYDPYSVMHYPQCNGSQTGDLVITSLDAQGASLLYGAPGSQPPPPPPSGTTTETRSGSVAAGANVNYGPFSVAAGTSFKVVMTGSGDPDLYVRFGAAPTTTSYNCRPYLNGASETCDVTVPAGQSSAYIMVRGYTQATFSLTITYTKPTTTPPTGPVTETFSSQSVALNTFKHYTAFSVKAGTQFKAAMSGGTGDADLYVRFGAQPTLSAYNCRPYLGGNAETCDLTVPAGVTTAYVSTYGYSAASGYSLSVTYTKP